MRSPFLDHEVLGLEWQRENTGRSPSTEIFAEFILPPAWSFRWHFLFYCVNNQSNEEHSSIFLLSLLPASCLFLPRFPLLSAAGLNPHWDLAQQCSCFSGQQTAEPVRGASHTCSAGSRPSAEADTFQQTVLRGPRGLLDAEMFPVCATRWPFPVRPSSGSDKGNCACCLWPPAVAWMTSNTRHSVVKVIHM